MRIFNGTKSQVILPYAGGQKISIDPMSVSGNVGPTDEFVALIVTSYTDKELALIVSGPYELATASRNPVAVSYIVQTLDEAVRRFAPADAKVEKTPEPKKEEPKKEEPIVEEELKPATEEAKEETSTDDPKPAEKKRGRGRPKKNPTA